MNSYFHGLCMYECCFYQQVVASCFCGIPMYPQVKFNILTTTESHRSTARSGHLLPGYFEKDNWRGQPFCIPELHKCLNQLLNSNVQQGH